MAIYKKCEDCGTGMWFTSDQVCPSCERARYRKADAERLVAEAKRAELRRQLATPSVSRVTPSAPSRVTPVAPRRTSYNELLAVEAEKEAARRRRRQDEDYSSTNDLAMWAAINSSSSESSRPSRCDDTPSYTPSYNSRSCDDDSSSRASYSSSSYGGSDSCSSSDSSSSCSSD